MSALPVDLLIAFVILAATLAARVATSNRTVKRRLVFVPLLALAAAGIAAGASLGRLTPELTTQLRALEQALLGLAMIVLVVTLAINPLRADRVPEKFPTIVQDAIIVVVFVLVQLIFLPDNLMATSAVGAIVVGFALQDTLGNAFAGLAIQAEKPFRIGDWIGVAQHEGQVMEVSWRATKLRTRAGNFVVVPNNFIAKEAIVNYSEPITQTQLTVEVGTTYDAAPNRVKAVLLEAVGRAPLALASPAPDVLLDKFGDSAITFKVRFWVGNFGDDDEARDQVRTAIYYALARERIEIPYPIQIQFERTEATEEAARDAGIARALSNVLVFGPLSDEDRLQLARRSPERLFARGEVVVRQGEPGGSMFVVRAGRVAIILEPSGQQVSTTSGGGYFGEMSLLTGDPRTATVKALDDTTVLEITAETFREVILPNPGVIEQIGQIAMERRAELERSRAQTPTQVGAAHAAGFIDRVKRFLRLPSW